MLGWDTPDYIRLAHETLTIGPINSIIGHSYPQLYVQLLAFIGLLAGNVTLIEKILPFFFALISVYLTFRVVSRISGNVHVAGASAFLQVLSIGFLEILSSSNRNLMAFAIAWAAILSIENTWHDNQDLRQVALSAALMGIVAATQFETFIVLSLTVIIASLFTRGKKKVFTAIGVSAAPVACLALFLPQFFSVYLSSFSVPILTSRTNLTVSDFVFWTGASIPAVPLFFLGDSYLIFAWRKKGNPLALLTFVWCNILLGIFLAVSAGIIGLSPELGFRALLLVPSYILVPIGSLPLWKALSRLRASPTLPTRYLNTLRVARIAVPVLLLTIILLSAATSVPQSQIYFNPYISSTSYNKLALGLTNIRDNSLGVPVVIMNGESVWHANLYREYIGELIGEHFAYFGSLSNLLLLMPTPSSSSDPYVFKMQNYYSTTYLEELQGNLSSPSPFIHSSFITDRNALFSHPILVITPDLYDSPIPFALGQFDLGSGVYVIPPHDLTDLSVTAPAGNVSLSRDGVDTTLPATYSYLDPNDPNLATIIVNASRGYQSYNVTSFPSDWAFSGILQGGDPSAPDYSPTRPNGDPALVGNDPADSIGGWTPVPSTATIQTDSLTKKEGTGSLRVQGTTDSYNNLGAVLSFSPIDASGYGLIDFWAKCDDCSGMAVYLIDATGANALFYGVGLNSNTSVEQFMRYSVPLASPTAESKGFGIHSVTSLSFLAFSPTQSQITLWIDDVVFQQQDTSALSIYKGRVLPSDSVEFLFTRELAGQAENVPNLPVLSYPPALDILSLTTTALITFCVLMLFENRPRFVARLRKLVRDLRPRKDDQPNHVGKINPL
jgi:hypothetical protein